MANHKKPTPEELEEQMKASLEKLEKEDQEPTNTPSEPENETEIQETETPEDQVNQDDTSTESESEPEEPQEEPEKETSVKTEPKDTDWKKRYEDSSREAHLLYGKGSKMFQAIEKAGEIPEPTEEELKSEFEDWEDMSDFEKRMAKDNLHNKRKFEAIDQAAKEFKEIDEWGIKVDKFIADPETIAKYPELDGKEEEFKLFSTTKPSRVNQDFDDLVFAFLYTAEKNKPAPKKGKMLETGSGGPNNKPKPNDGTISVEESRRLMKSDYKKYLEFVRAGKIRFDEV